MATEGQFREIIAQLLTRTTFDESSPWSKVPTEAAQALIREPSRLPETLPGFIANGARLIVGELKKFVVDRSKPFDPVKFIGKGWTIWKGPKDGDGLTGEEEQDARSLALTELDISKVTFEHCLKGKEKSIVGNEKILRLEHNFSSLVRPDAAIAQALFEEPGHQTLEWIRTNLGKTWFDIPGTVLRRPGGRRCILCLFWYGGRWRWSYNWLDCDWLAENPSFLLASD